MTSAQQSGNSSPAKSEGLRVIGVGLARTGTFSLKCALEKLLGGPCYHMHIAREIPEDIDFWIEACRRDPSDAQYRHFFRNYCASVDAPMPAFYKRLMEVYPDAKVILTMRDVDAWYDSVHATVVPFLENLYSTWNRFLLLFSATRRSPEMHELIVRRIYGDENRLGDKEYMTTLFGEHVESVKRSVPPERLLIFEAKDGWAPLCAFLNLPVPDEPYPHGNSHAEYDLGARRVKLGKVLLGGLVVGLLAALTAKILASRSRV